MLDNKKMSKEINKKDILELLTLKEVCEALKCHPNTLRQWDAKGILVAIRIGEKKLMRYSKKEIAKFLKHNENNQ